MIRSAKIMTVCFVAVLGGVALCSSVWAFDGMVSYWKLDEGCENIAYDSVNGNHGTIHGTINETINGETWTAGIVDGALRFDGVDNYVHVPDDDSLDAGTWSSTFMAWVNTTAIDRHPDHVTAITHGRGGVYPIRTLGMKGSDWQGFGTVDARIEDNSGHQVTSSDDGPVINDGIWHHIAVVFDREYKQMIRYVDGAQAGTADSLESLTTSSDSKHPLRIGTIGEATTAGEYWKGLIDEVAIYNRALCALEIEQHYQNGMLGYGYSAAPELFAICKIELAIAEKVEAIEKINTAIAKEWPAYAALDEMLASENISDLNRSDIISAKENILAAIQQQEHSINALERSLQKLQDSLLLLGSDVQP
jgi:hypothetical protein